MLKKTILRKLRQMSFMAMLIVQGPPASGGAPTGGPFVQPLIGIQNFNLNTFMGRDIGWLKWPTLLSVVFAAVSFIIATYYIINYNRGYFAGRKIPASWVFILFGIFITSIAEIGEMLVFYESPGMGMIELKFLLLYPHVFGGIALAVGSYLLYKEATT